MRIQSLKKRSVEIHVSQIHDALESTEAVRNMTTNLLKMCDEYGILESKNPLGEAAGIIYIAGILTNHPVTLLRIARNAGTSPKTVRKYKTYLASNLKTKKEWPSLPLKGK